MKLKGLVLLGLIAFAVGRSLVAQTTTPPLSNHAPAALTQVLGRPTDHSIALSVLSREQIEVRVEFGTASGTYPEKTEPCTVSSGIPAEIELAGLKSDTRYHYRLLTRPSGNQDFAVTGEEATFHTQRPAGSTFSFSLQGDSHPERPGKMFDPALYAQTMRNVAQENPDFYITMGDDFSIERLIERHDLTQASVNGVYEGQRPFLGIVGRSSPLFLVNGNHEQAALSNLVGTTNNPAVLAGKARTSYYPLPAPDGFYTGDTGKVDQVGLLRDYYSWTWGDALFVVIDFYWHSPVTVDNKPGARGQEKGGDKTAKDDRGDKRTEQKPVTASTSTQGNVITSVDELGELVPPGGGGRKGGGGGVGNRDFWGITLGDEQYQWLTKTLSESNARWKFVFCHHVLGTGRGGVERASLFEWGGRDNNGSDLFAEKRPGWALPIQQLMAKHGVTIFFQGHDHIFARQNLDGIVYQSCPNPADPTHTAFNSAAYRSGDLFPNSGHIKVTVSPEKVDVDYVRTWMDGDLTSGHTNGEVANHYTVSAPLKTAPQP